MTRSEYEANRQLAPSKPSKQKESPVPTGDKDDPSTWELIVIQRVLHKIKD